MEHIGSGWQFDAYAEGDCVVKIPTNRAVMATRVARSYPRLLLSPLSLLRKVERLQESRHKVLAELERREIDRRLVANFRREGHQYLQDRVIPLYEALDRGYDPMDLLERYLQSILRNWRSGFSETSFNFTVNHGLNADGEVVVLDVGELTFDRAEAQEFLDGRLWRNAFSARVIEPAQADHLFRRMEAWVTQNRILGEWKDADYVRVRPAAPDRAALLRDRKTVPQVPEFRTIE